MRLVIVCCLYVHMVIIKTHSGQIFFFFLKKKLPTVCGGFSYLNFLRDHNGKSANCFCIQQGDFDNKQNPKFAKSLT